jgi:UDP-glucose 4-epimerase
MIFIRFMKENEREFLEILIGHLKGLNRKIKDIAANVLIHFCLELSNYFSENQDDYYRNLIEYTVRKMKNCIEKDEDRFLTISCIKAYGSMAKAIKIKEGEKMLHFHLYFLIENTQSTMFVEF